MNGPIPAVAAWSPAFLGQVRLVGAWSRPAPARIPLAMGGPAPMGAERPRLGEFSWSRLPTSILFVTGGTAGLYLGGALPSPADVISKALGVAFIGWGVYYLFAEPATKKVEKSADQPQEPRLTPTKRAFDAMTASFVSPAPGTKPDLNFWGTSFDVKAVWYNGSDEPGNFTWDIWAQTAVAGTPADQTPGKSVYTSTIVDLAPHNDSLPLTVTIPLVKPEKPGFTGQGLPNPTYRIELTLRKFSPDGPVAAGPTISLGPFPYY